MKYVGLSSDEVKKLQVQYGLNVLPSGKGISAIKIFLAHLIH